MGHPAAAQQHCDIFPDTITFKRLRDELDSYEAPIMLICEEGATHDLIRRRLVSALHTTEKGVVDMLVPDNRFYHEDLVRCCKIARETNSGIIVAYGLGVAVKYARATSACAWSESDPWQKWHFGIGMPALKRIPFAHVFASLEHYDKWEQIFGVSIAPKGEPDFAIQVTSAIY